MKERQQKLLLAIIDNFIQTALPVGSKTIVTEYKLEVSPATVRNEMAKLEEKGLIAQPYTSAGRVPTAKGYRFFVESMKVSKKEQDLAKTSFAQQVEQYQNRLDRQRVYRAVDVLSRVVDNMAFATIPGNDRTIFLGLSNVLRQPEFLAHPEQASQVVEVLEREFVSLVDSLGVERDIKIYIGEENLIEQFSSCSMMVGKYRLDDREGTIGILGPMRMRYSYNKAALEQARDFLEEGA